MYASKGTMFDRLKENGIRGYTAEWIKHDGDVHMPPVQMARAAATDALEGLDAVFVIDSVPDKEANLLKDFKKELRLPYRTTWWECPMTVMGSPRSPEVIKLAAGLATRIGCLLRVFDDEDPHRIFLGSPNRATNMAWGMVFSECERINLIAGPMSVFILSSDDGVTVSEIAIWSPMGGGSQESESNYLARYCLHSISQALEMMECKNVKKVTNKSPQPLLKSKKQRRNAEKRNPLCTFYTLRVFTGQGKKCRVIYDGPNSTDPAMLKAHHLCRGHFAHYTAGAPMFGNPKLVGRFWHPPHVRGSLDAGLIEKDYEVVAVL